MPATDGVVSPDKNMHANKEDIGGGGRTNGASAAFFSSLSRFSCVPLCPFRYTHTCTHIYTYRYIMDAPPSASESIDTTDRGAGSIVWAGPAGGRRLLRDAFPLIAHRATLKRPVPPKAQKARTSSRDTSAPGQQANESRDAKEKHRDCAHKEGGCERGKEKEVGAADGQNEGAAQTGGNERRQKGGDPCRQDADGAESACAPRVHALAQHMLRADVVRMRPHDFFTFESGWSAPVYVDLRLSLANPDARSAIAAGLADAIRSHFMSGRGRDAPAVTIVGVASGAISHATLAADRLGLPAAYVRPAPKDHGTGRRVEGHVVHGMPCVVVEDVLGTGGSVRSAIEALRAQGAHVLGVCAVFSYDFDALLDTIDAVGVPFVRLTNLPAVIERARHSGRLDADGVNVIAAWHKSKASRCTALTR